MGWYRFRIHYHGPGGQRETYKHLQDGLSVDCVKDELKEWADEAEQDDGHYGYHTSYEAVEAPPVEWLRDRVRWGRRGLVASYERVQFLASELRKLEPGAVQGLEPRRREDEIPVLPKKEVPEAGYRAIYDWMLTNVHPDLLAGGEKTMSQVVIGILEKAVR